MTLKRKTGFWLALAFVFCMNPAAGSFPFYGGFPAYAAEEAAAYVADDAELFTEAEEMALEEKGLLLAAEMNADVVIVTEDDTGGMSARDFSEQYYIDGDFGVGNNYNGIIFLIDMDNRELFINSVGDMMRYFTDERREKMLDGVYGFAADGDFYGAAEEFLSGTEKYYKKGIEAGQYNYDEETGEISPYRRIRWYEAAIAFGVAAAAAGFFCMSVVNEYGMKRQKREAEGFCMAYRANCNYQMNQVQDHFLRENTTHVVIRTNNSGGGRSGGSPGGGRSTSHSRSGRSFSGSGRKF